MSSHSGLQERSGHRCCAEFGAVLSQRALYLAILSGGHPRGAQHSPASGLHARAAPAFMVLLCALIDA